MLWSQRGFTLLEILLAVTLLGLVVGIGMSSLHAGIDSYSRVSSHSLLLQEARGGLLLLQEDLGGIAPVYKPFIDCSTDSFTYQVWDVEQNALLPVAYRFSEGGLVRTRGDASADTPPEQVVIMEHVVSGAFSYRVDGSWTDGDPEDKRCSADALAVSVELMRGEDHFSAETAMLLSGIRHAGNDAKASQTQ